MPDFKFRIPKNLRHIYWLFSRFTSTRTTCGDGRKSRLSLSIVRMDVADEPVAATNLTRATTDLHETWSFTTDAPWPDERRQLILHRRHVSSVTPSSRCITARDYTNVYGTRERTLVSPRGSGRNTFLNAREKQRDLI